MLKPILETRNLTKTYGDFIAASEVNISIEPGAIHGIIGPNGAGKTTLFNCLAGTIPATSGSIFLQGKEIGHLPQHTRPSIGISRSFQVTSLFPDLSVFENLRLAWQALKPASGFIFWRSVPRQGDFVAGIAHVLRRVGLTEATDAPVSALSHGQQRLLEVGMAMMAKPQVLLLDEPTSGMGIDDVPEMVRLLRVLREECTILLIEHNVGLVAEVCDLVTVMQAGEIIAVGTPAEISADEAVKSAYLGEAQ